VWENDHPVGNLQTPNEFGALKIRHQPLAEASGMDGFWVVVNLWVRRPLVASPLVGDGRQKMTTVGDKPRRYLYHPLLAHYRFLNSTQFPPLLVVVNL